MHSGIVLLLFWVPFRAEPIEEEEEVEEDEELELVEEVEEGLLFAVSVEESPVELVLFPPLPPPIQGLM